MSDRPMLPFYVADHLTNDKVKLLTLAEQGAWFRVLCFLHMHKGRPGEYGIARLDVKSVGILSGIRTNLVEILRKKGLLKGADSGESVAPFYFVPRHAGKEGEPVLLIPEQDGPLLYCSRMVRDEYKRRTKGASTRFGARTDDTAENSPSQRQGDSPSPGMVDSPSQRQGDGYSFSVSVSMSEKEKEREGFALSPPAGTADLQEKANGKASSHGTRFGLTALPDDWRAWLQAEDALLDPDEVFRDFSDYWVSKAGADARKHDWTACWRVWCRRERKFRKEREARTQTAANALANLDPTRGYR